MVPVAPFVIINTHTIECGLKKKYSIEYALILADFAHNRGMSIVVKNAIELYDELKYTFDGAVVENCMLWNECDALSAWTLQDKGVFAVEYNNKLSCNKMKHPDGTSVKYCNGNNGKYLCTDKKWSSCDKVGAVVTEPTRHIDYHHVGVIENDN